MFHRKPIVVAVALACGGLSMAHAQTAPVTLPEVRVESQTIRSGTPMDTVFTGSKTDTALRDLPASVVVVTKENLEEQGVINFNHAMENVSGVQPLMAGGYGFADNYTIRGLAARYLRDGYPDGTTQNGYYRTMWDIERIEVLKGPGSALYGSGQPGGTINVVSKAPRFQKSVEYTATAGSFGTFSGSIDATGAISNDMASRVIVGYESSDGWRDLEREIGQFKATLLWNIAPDKALTIDYDHRNIKVKPDNYGIIFNADRQLADVSRDAKYFSPFNFAEQEMDRLTFSHNWVFNADLSMRTGLIYDKRDLSFLRNGGGNAGNSLNQMTGREARAQNDDDEFITVQNEWLYKLQHGSVKHTILAGIEFSKAKLDTVRTSYGLPDIADIDNPVVQERSLADATTTTLAFDRQLRSDTWSVYLQDQIALSEQFKVRAGYRNDRVDFSDKGFQANHPTNVNREVDSSQSLNSGSLGAVWQPTREWSFYTGVASGKFINIATESQLVTTEPEKSLQTEIGAKADLLNGRLGLNLAYFQAKRDNYYVTLPGASDPTPDGHDKSKGFEFDLTSEPIKGLNLLANMIIQDVENTSDNEATNSLVNGGPITESLHGKRPTGVAEKSGRVWASYTLQEGEMRGLGFGLGATYKGDSYADSLNLYKVPSYTVFDTAIFYNQPKWEIALNIRNLTDKTYYTNPTFVGALPGAERNALISFRLKTD